MQSKYQIPLYEIQIICAMLITFTSFVYFFKVIGETSETKLPKWTVIQNSTELQKSNL